MSRPSGPRLLFPLVVAALIGLGVWLFLPRDENSTLPDDGPGSEGQVDPTDGTGDGPDTGPDGAGDPGTELPVGPSLDSAGRVIDHRTGRGVPDATVTVTTGRDPSLLPLDHTRTDATGAFLCRFSDVDPLEFTVRAEGYSSAVWRIEGGLTPAGLPFLISDLELAVAPESILWIRPEVTGREPEEPIIVEVRLRQPRLPAELGEPFRTQQNVELIFPETRIGGLAAGRYLLSFRTSKQRLLSRELELGMGEERTIDFVLGPPIPIHGVVRHDDRAVAGGRLLVWGRDQRSSNTAMVDARGQYQLSLPAPGMYSVSFTPSREFPEDGTGGVVEIEVTAGGRVDIDFRSSRLVGRVFGPDGGPAGGMMGTLFGPQALSFVTDADGRFEFDAVPDGEYRWHFSATPEGAFAPSRTFTVDRDLDVTYSFEPSTTLEVVVVRDPAPSPGSEVGRPQVALVEPGGRITPLRPADAPDQYEWPLAGGLGVVAQRGWAPWFFELAPADHPAPQTALLTPGGELTVTIFTGDGRAAGGQPFRIVGLDAPPLPEAWCLRVTGPRGEARLALPPGTYRIEADLPEGRVEREIRIHARAATEARLP